MEMSHTFYEFLVMLFIVQYVPEWIFAMATAKHNCFHFFSKPAISNPPTSLQDTNKILKIESLISLPEITDSSSVFQVCFCLFGRFAHSHFLQCLYLPMSMKDKLLNLSSFRIMSTPRFAAIQYANKSCMYRMGWEIHSSWKFFCSVLSELYYLNITE